MACIDALVLFDLRISATRIDHLVIIIVLGLVVEIQFVLVLVRALYRRRFIFFPSTKFLSAVFLAAMAFVLTQLGILRRPLDTALSAA